MNITQSILLWKIFMLINITQLILLNFAENLIIMKLKKLQGRKKEPTPKSCPFDLQTHIAHSGIHICTINKLKCKKSDGHHIQEFIFKMILKLYQTMGYAWITKL